MEINKLREIIALCQETGITKFSTPELTFEIELKSEPMVPQETKQETMSSYDLMLEDPVAYEEEMINNGRN